RAWLQRAGDLPLHEGLEAPTPGRAGALASRRAWEPPGWRGRDPGRSRAEGNYPRQGPDGFLAGGPSHLAQPRRPFDGHDDVRTRRDDRGASGALRTDSTAPGRDGWLHRVHLLDVSARAHGSLGDSPGRRIRVPQDPGHLPDLSG